MNAFLKPLGDRQVMRLDRDMAVRHRRGLGHEQHVIKLAVDEILVAGDVSFVDVEPSRLAEEPLEFMDAGLGHVYVPCRELAVAN
jgi:hypothetical protein